MNGDSRTTLTFWLSIVITCVWVISFFVDIVMKGYEPPVTVHALMMIVAGALFSEGVFRRSGDASTPPTPQEKAPDV